MLKLELKARQASYGLYYGEQCVAAIGTNFEKQVEFGERVCIAVNTFAEALEALRHALRNVESMLKLLPLKAPDVERQSLTTWAAGLRAVLEKMGDV